MRPFLVASLLFASACAAISGLEDPHDEAAPATPNEAGIDSSPPPPVLDAGDGAAPDTSVTDAPIDAPDTGPTTCDETGLLGRWKFDEGSGTIAHDCTSAKRDGTNSGAIYVAGKVGTGALRFTSDMVDLGNPQALQLTAGMTLAAWIKITSGSIVSGRIISKGSMTDRGYELNIQSGTSIEFKIATGTTSTSELATNISSGVWHHVAGTYGAANTAMRLYVDGVMVGENLSAPASQRNGPLNVLIGAMPGETAYKFDGDIDDVRIYSRALTASDVQAVMNAK